MSEFNVSTCLIDSQHNSGGYGECLLDKPSTDLLDAHRAAKNLPGESFDENKQCELVFGNGSKICPYMVLFESISNLSFRISAYYSDGLFSIAALQTVMVHDIGRRTRGLPDPAHAMGRWNGLRERSMVSARKLPNARRQKSGTRRRQLGILGRVGRPLSWEC